MSRIKGTAIAARMEFVNSKFGEEGLSSVLAALKPHHRELLNSPVSISKWYPLELSDDLMGCVERILGQGDGALCRQMGVLSCQRGLTSVYQGVKEMGDVGSIARGIARTTGVLWKSYYDSGKMKARRVEDNELELELVEIELATPWLCELLIAFIGTHIEMLGGVDPQVAHPECRTRGGATCRWIAHWE